MLDFLAATRDASRSEATGSQVGVGDARGVPAALLLNPVSHVPAADGEVPGSAVLVFDIELLELVAGLPEGYMFVWNGEVSANLFEEIDKDGDGEVLLEEVIPLSGGKWDPGSSGSLPGPREEGASET